MSKDWLSEKWLIIALSLSTVGAFLLMADATQNAAYFGRLHNWLLPINTLLLAILVGLIAYNIGRLVRQLQRKAPGSRLTLRLVILLTVLSSIPVIFVYAFSVWLLERGVDSWFDVRVEQALEDALDLSRSSLDLNIRTLRKQVEPQVGKLVGTDDLDATFVINDMLKQTGASEIAFFDSSSRIIASGSEVSTTVVPRLPAESILQLVTRGESYVGLDPIKDAGLHIRLVLPVESTMPAEKQRMVQFLFPVTDRISELAINVQDAFGKYNELVYLRTPLKQNFILILSMVLVLGVLLAVYAAFYLSQSLLAPIGELAEGTKAVAAGEYHKKLTVRKSDDLGMLASSFNQMTERLGVARDKAIINQRIIENQRTYLQTILEHLSSGVLSLDPALTLKTVNAVASEILEVNLNEFIGTQFAQIGTTHDHLKEFCQTVLDKTVDSEKEWQVEIEVFTPEARKILKCSRVRLPGEDQYNAGYVLMLDDVTTLIQAQRDSAWGEVARRLAHEIKNPLTPIQLSAERLRRKLLPDLEQEQAEMLDRSTHTIVQQVESMRLMVDDFSDYARKPMIVSQPVDLNDLVSEVTELYRDHPQKVRFVLELDPHALLVRGDPVRLRQLIHNLLKNSVEALADIDASEVRISTFPFDLANSKYAGLQVADNGPGFPSEFLGRAFEPYMTTKVKGNGLGLAIVKKIVEEHNGVVRAQNLSDGGAAVNIRFPMHQYNVVDNALPIGKSAS